MHRTYSAIARVAFGLALALAACTGGAADADGIVVYTSVTQSTVDLVVAAFEDSADGTPVEVFRAPTGEINARIAAELRDGGIRADVVWLTDPLTMQQLDADGHLASWTPDNAAVVPSDLRSDRFWGTRVLSMLIVVPDDLAERPTAWADLASPPWVDGLALPDPTFAGSAFGALAWFDQQPDLGPDWLDSLARGGAIQVQSPGEVVAGVAEGRFTAGVTLAFSVNAAIEDGSPVEVIWPEPGAIAMYSPIAVFGETEAPDGAESFVEFVLSSEGQSLIAESGWQPVDATVAFEVGGPQVTVDWEAAFARRDELLDEHRARFGG